MLCKASLRAALTCAPGSGVPLCSFTLSPGLHTAHIAAPPHSSLPCTSTTTLPPLNHRQISALGATSPPSTSHRRLGTLLGSSHTARLGVMNSPVTPMRAAAVTKPAAMPGTPSSWRGRAAASSSSGEGQRAREAPASNAEKSSRRWKK